MPINFLRILLLLLGLSYLLSVSAIPATRIQNLDTQDNSAAFPYLTQLNTVLELENGEEQRLVDVNQEFTERRMIFETQDDYGGTEANPDHDPKIPAARR